MERRRRILDQRDGEDVKAARRRADDAKAAELISLRDAQRRRPPGSSKRDRSQVTS